MGRYSRVLFRDDDSIEPCVVFRQQLDRCFEVAVVYRHDSLSKVKVNAKVRSRISTDQYTCLEVWNDVGFNS